MIRIRYTVRFLLALMLTASVFCTIAASARSRESIGFMSSMAEIDAVEEAAIDNYIRALKTMGMETHRVSRSDGVWIVGTQQESAGLVTVSLRATENRLYLTGRWDGSFGISGLIDRNRQRDLSDFLRRMYVVPWITLTEPIKR